MIVLVGRLVSCRQRLGKSSVVLWVSLAQDKNNRLSKTIVGTVSIKLAGLTGKTSLAGALDWRALWSIINGPANTRVNTCTRVSQRVSPIENTHRFTHNLLYRCEAVRTWNQPDSSDFFILPGQFYTIYRFVWRTFKIRFHAFGQAIGHRSRGMYPEKLVTTIGKLFKDLHVFLEKWLPHRSHLDLHRRLSCIPDKKLGVQVVHQRHAITEM